MLKWVKLFINIICKPTKVFSASGTVGVKLSTFGCEFEGALEAYLEPSQRPKVKLFAKIVENRS